MSHRDTILSALSGEWRSTPEIARDTGIKVSTVHRILSSELKWETVEMGPMAWRPEAPHQVRTWRRASE